MTVLAKYLTTPGVLYLLAIPVGLLACYSSISLGFDALDDPEKFRIANLGTAVSCAILFAFKIPFMYTHNLPLATGAFAIQLIGWSIAVVIFIMVLNKQKDVDNLKTSPK